MREEEEDEKNEEQMDKEGAPSSSSKKTKINNETKGGEEGGRESLKRRKTKSKVSAPAGPCVAKKREEIPNSPIPSTSKGSSNAGEDLERNGIQTRSKTLPQR